MGRLTPRWRRYWGLRPGELRQPLHLGQGRAMGGPVSGPHGRGWLRRHQPHPEPVEPSTIGAEFPLALVADDAISERAKAHAVETLVHVARFAPRPVLHGRVTLRLHRDPALERPAIAKAALDLSGRSVRAHVAARRPIEAVDLLAKRLRRNLENLDKNRRTHRRVTGVTEAGAWRHGNLPSPRPECLPRPGEERELIGHKTYAPSPRSPEDAALDLQMLDYNFYLFTDSESGAENVIYQDPDGRFALIENAPVLLAADAIERLDAGGERFVFFLDAQTRRGHVLYRRYDGHYGLLEPGPEG